MLYDAKYLNEHADLKEVYERVTGNTLKRHSDQWEGACPDCGGTKRFRITDKIPYRGFCRECGKSFSALDIVLSQRNLSFRQACEELAFIIGISSDEAQYKGGSVRNDEKPKSNRFTEFEVLPDEPSDLWQRHVIESVNYAHGYLMSIAGEKQREYLYRRGFTDRTLNENRIGFNPKTYPLGVNGADGEPIKATSGIWIPTFAKLMDGDSSESLLRVKVRCEDTTYKSLMKSYEEGQRETPPQKYWHIREGIAKSLFCADYARNFDTNENIIFTEGEFDAMTINQVAGDLCHAVTFGSHSNIGKTANYWHAWFSAPSHIVVCFDNEPDPQKANDVRKHEQDLCNEIIRAQTLDDEEYRAGAPIIRHLPEHFHDWNDLLCIDNGAQIIRDILTEMFGL